MANASVSARCSSSPSSSSSETGTVSHATANRGLRRGSARANTSSGASRAAAAATSSAAATQSAGHGAGASRIRSKGPGGAGNAGNSNVRHVTRSNRGSVAASDATAPDSREKSRRVDASTRTSAAVHFFFLLRRMGVSDQPPLHAEPSAAATAAAGVTGSSSSPPVSREPSFAFPVRDPLAASTKNAFSFSLETVSARSAARRAAEATVSKCASSPSARVSAGATNALKLAGPRASLTRAMARATCSPYRRRRSRPLEKISRTATGKTVSLASASASNAAAAARAVLLETPGRKLANTRASRMDDA